MDISGFDLDIFSAGVVVYSLDLLLVLIIRREMYREVRKVLYIQTISER